MSQTEWLIEDYLPLGSKAVLYGKPGTGKSAVGLLMASCVAGGQHFFGKKCRRAPAFLLPYEGIRGFDMRRVAYYCHLNLDSDTNLIRFGDLPPFSHPGEYEAGAECISRSFGEAAEIYGPPGLIMIDTINMSFVGDENDTEAMTAYMQYMDMLQRPFPGCVILMIHHEAKLGGARGSSVLQGTSDAILKITRSGADRRLAIEKMKDGPDDVDTWFTLAKHDIMSHNGILLQTVVPELASRPAPKLNGKTKPPAKEVANDTAIELALSVLNDLGAKGSAPITVKAFRTRYMPLSGKSKGTFRMHWMRLLEDLEIRNLVKVNGDTIELPNGGIAGPNGDALRNEDV